MRTPFDKLNHMSDTDKKSSLDKDNQIMENAGRF
jgi:hypothetical protein